MKGRILDGKEEVALLDDKVLQETAAPSSLLSSDPSPQVGDVAAEASIGTLAMASSIVELRGPFALFQSADITFLASLVFGSFGFGATELFRRVFTAFFLNQDANASGGGSELVLLGAAALACILTSAVATPFEMMRVRSMGLVESKGWKDVLVEFLGEKREARGSSIGDRSDKRQSGNKEFGLSDIEVQDLKPLWGGFGPTLSRELPFAVVKFWAFDVIAKLFLSVINSGTDIIDPIQVGVGAEGLAVSAIAGALAGVAGAIISHPADLILTLTSSSKKKKPPEDGATTTNEATGEVSTSDSGTSDWRTIVDELISEPGGIGNLFLGLPARGSFFFMVIGLQFFLYDYVKGVFEVGSEDLTLVLDVFYAIRQGLVSMNM